MPHVSVHLTAGRSDEVKQALTDALAEAVKKVLGSTDAAVSVAVVDETDWKTFHDREILTAGESLLRKPGYEI